MNIVVSGVGGNLVSQFVEHLGSLKNVNLILAPNKDSRRVRESLDRQNWHIDIDEEIIEKGRTRWIFCANSFNGGQINGR